MTDPRQAFHAAVLAVVGYAPESIEPGRLHRFATSSRHGDTAGWCRLFADLRGGVFGCYRAGISETWQPERGQAMTHAQRVALARQVARVAVERDRAQRAHWVENRQRITRLWTQCVPLTPGDPVTLYLERRGLTGVWPLPACLRLHAALPYWDGEERIGTFPTMVAPLMSAGGRIVALHRTYLTTDGRKAGVSSPKKLTTTAGPLAGASIPLHRFARAFAIAEGIETALAAWCASGVPTVAAYSAGNLAAWRWPAGVQRLVIFADHDRAGIEAAETLQGRAIRAGLQASVMTPTDPGADWADVWADRGAVLVETAAAA